MSHGNVNSSRYILRINGATIQTVGNALAQFVETLRYNSEGCVFDPRWCHWNFSLT